MRISRRQFTQSAALSGAAALMGGGRKVFAGAAPLTAFEIVEQIKSHLGFAWDNTTYRDTFKMGDPNTPVTGVCSSFMSTFDVIKKSHAAGLNFVISHEPTIWSDADLLAPVVNDPLYKTKLEYVNSNKMIIWRIHDHWHRVRPDPFSAAETAMLGWEKYEDPQNPRLFRIPQTTLRALAEYMATRRKFHSLRMIGDPDLKVSSVTHGGHGLAACMSGLQNADVVMATDVREWEIEYIRDLVRTGLKKGFIDAPHETEDGGMEAFARWLPKQIPGLRVEFIPTTDRLWTI
jgi:putative NIF3 family GTP cyclohydrolase 1 type 2